MTTFITKTADSIKALRLEKGLTQEELGRRYLYQGKRYHGGKTARLCREWTA